MLRVVGVEGPAVMGRVAQRRDPELRHRRCANNHGTSFAEELHHLRANHFPKS